MPIIQFAVTIIILVKNAYKRKIKGEKYVRSIMHIRYDELQTQVTRKILGDTKRHGIKRRSKSRPEVETFKRYQQVVEEINSDTEENAW